MFTTPISTTTLGFRHTQVKKKQRSKPKAVAKPAFPTNAPNVKKQQSKPLTHSNNVKSKVVRYVVSGCHAGLLQTKELTVCVLFRRDIGKKEERTLIKQGFRRYYGFPLFVKRDSNGRIVQWKNRLKVSRFTNLKSKPFAARCDLGCNRLFTTSQGLKRHRERQLAKLFYSGASAPYPCGHCPKRFYTKYDCKKHQGICTSAKLYERRKKLVIRSLSWKQR